MKDLGEADVILNMKLIKNKNGITLTQSHYVEKVLSRFGFNDGKTSPTPYDPSLTLRKNKKEPTDQLKYSQVVGSDRKSTRLNSSHIQKSRMPSSA